MHCLEYFSRRVFIFILKVDDLYKEKIEGLWARYHSPNLQTAERSVRTSFARHLAFKKRNFESVYRLNSTRHNAIRRRLTPVLKVIRKDIIRIGNSMISNDIWHKYHEWYFEIFLRNGRVKFETILKYHEWYLCQISRTNHAIKFFHLFILLPAKSL